VQTLRTPRFIGLVGFIGLVRLVVECVGNARDVDHSQGSDPYRRCRASNLDAYAADAEWDLGSIETGKLADLVVLSRDIMRAPPADILRPTVVRTVVDGRAVYSAPVPSSPQ
jgi:cytosine/adenosine deaminase-related metal-dependent hydrolase